MRSHVTDHLYDYLRDELDEPTRSSVERHLATCRECAEELRLVSEILNGLSFERPSQQLSPDYWRNFTLEVEHRIRRSEHRRKFYADEVAGWVRSLFIFRKRYVVALSGGLVLGILLALYILPPRTAPRREELTADRSAQASAPSTLATDTVSMRMSEYFRKSKVLLVGLSNMKMDEDRSIDLSGEQRVSRQLLHEARYLKNQSLDRRSERLITDLEKILIELANMKEQSDLPNVEILRGGIHQENLLFKIRMAESLYDSAQVVPANHHY